MNRYLILAAAIIMAFLISAIFADLYYYNKVRLPSSEGRWQTAYSDFRVFWTAGREFFFRYANDPAYGPIDTRYKRIYDTKEEFYLFRYSPSAAFLFSIFKSVPMGISLLIWSFATNILFLLSIILIDRIFSKAASLPPLSRILIAVVSAALVFRFYLNNVSLGQTDCFVLFLWAAFLSAYTRGNDVIGAILLALILQFKPFFLLVIPFIVIAGRWRLFFCASAAFIATLAMPMVMAGYRQEWLTLTKDWIDTIRSSVDSQIINTKNQSFGYLISKFLGLGGDIKAIYMSSYIVYASLIALLLFLKNRLRKDSLYPVFEVSFMTLAMLLSLPLAWKASVIYTMAPCAFVLCKFAQGMRSVGLYPAMGGFFVLTTVLRTGYINTIPIGIFLLLILVVTVQRKVDL